MNETHDLNRQPTIDPDAAIMPPAEGAAYSNGWGAAKRQDAETITRLRAELAETERERDELRTVVSLSSSDAWNQWLATKARAERAEADLAAAREVIGWALDEIDTHDGDYHHVTDVSKRNDARAFLERTAISNPRHP